MIIMAAIDWSKPSPPPSNPRNSPWFGSHSLPALDSASTSIFVQVADLDAVIVPVGGGGLISGISTAVKGLNPNCKVIGAEPLNVLRLGRHFEPLSRALS